MGPNGAGKTTLLRVIQGVQELDRGQRLCAPRLQPAVLDQHRTGLDLDRTVFEAAGNGNSHVFVGEQPVKVWMLQSRIRDRLAGAPSKKVLVVADRLVPAERLIEVVDQCRLGGATACYPGRLGGTAFGLGCPAYSHRTPLGHSCVLQSPCAPKLLVLRR